MSASTSAVSTQSPRTPPQDLNTTIKQSATAKPIDETLSGIGTRTLELCNKPNLDQKSLELLEVAFSVISEELEDILKYCSGHRRLTPMCAKLKECENLLLARITQAKTNDEMPPLVPDEPALEAPKAEVLAEVPQPITVQEEVLAETPQAITLQEETSKTLTPEQIAKNYITLQEETSKTLTPKQIAKNYITQIFNKQDYATAPQEHRNSVNKYICSMIQPGTRLELHLKLDSFTNLDKQLSEVIQKNAATHKKLAELVTQVDNVEACSIFGNRTFSQSTKDEVLGKLVPVFNECLKERENLQKGIEELINQCCEAFRELSKEIHFHQTRFPVKPTSTSDGLLTQSALLNYGTPEKQLRTFDKIDVIAQRMKLLKEGFIKNWDTLAGSWGMISRGSGEWKKCTDDFRKVGHFVMGLTPQNEILHLDPREMGRNFAKKNYIVKSISFPYLDIKESWKSDPVHYTLPVYKAVKEAEVISAPASSTSGS